MDAAGRPPRLSRRRNRRQFEVRSHCPPPPSFPPSLPPSPPIPSYSAEQQPSPAAVTAVAAAAFFPSPSNHAATIFRPLSCFPLISVRVSPSLLYSHSRPSSFILPLCTTAKRRPGGSDARDDDAILSQPRWSRAHSPPAPLPPPPPPPPPPSAAAAAAALETVNVAAASAALAAAGAAQGSDHEQRAARGRGDAGEEGDESEEVRYGWQRE